MTKDDIKKALEICADIRIPCNDCPYNAVGNCNGTLCADTLKFIIEQEKEIERLKANGYRSIMYAFENNRDKIVENIQTEIDDYKQSIKQAQIDVLNKVKERIKTAIDTYFNLDGGGYYLAEDAIDDIDELIKEVQNAEDKG